MATETELEEMIVRLTGDSAQYARSMEESVSSTQAAAKEVEAAAHRIEGFGTALQGFAASATQALGALQVGNLLRDALGNFQEAEGISLKLGVTLEANGRDVAAVTADYEAYAKQLQRTTLMEDDAVLALLTKAETFKLTGDAAKRAVSDSVALAAVTGGTAEEYLRLSAALEKGDVKLAQSMARMVPQLRGIEDESQFLAAAQQLIATGMKAAEAETRTSAGAFKALSRDFGNLLEGFGAFVAQGVQPLVSGLTAVVGWLENLDDDTKEAITVVAALAAGFLALGPALTTVGIIGAAVFNPVTLGMAAVITGAVALVKHLGGIEAAWETVQEAGGAAWDYVRAKTAEFVAYAQPVTDALVSLFTAAWGTISEAATAFWDRFTSGLDYVTGYWKEVWDGVAVATGVTWGGIRDTIQNVILGAEFTLRNFGDVADFVWSSIALGFVEFANEVEHFFTSTAPTLLSWFGEHWPEVIANVVMNSQTLFKNLFDNIVNVMSNLPGLVAGTTAWADVWKPLTTGFVQAITEMPKIQAREVGALEQQLREQVEQSGAALSKSFEQFRAEKLDEFAENAEQFIPPTMVGEAVQQATSAGHMVGGAFAKEAGKEMGKLDAALFGSAEAIARVADFQERMRGAAAGGKGSAAGGTGGTAATAHETTPAAMTASRDTEVFKEMRDLLRTIANKPGLMLEPAGLTE